MNILLTEEQTKLVNALKNGMLDTSCVRRCLWLNGFTDEQVNLICPAFITEPIVVPTSK